MSWLSVVTCSAVYASAASTAFQLNQSYLHSPPFALPRLCVHTLPVFYLQPRQIAFVKAFTAKQHELGIYGSVGEIGVHHGKFLIPIVGNALAGEPAVAMDLFEDQSGNVDTSGACVC